MASSKIEWTEQTWNPTAGCLIKSAGCKNCYAMRMAARLAAMGQPKYAGTTTKVRKSGGKNLDVWNGHMVLDEASLAIPLKRKQPTTWFVNSMSDLFYGDEDDRLKCERQKLAFEPVPFDFIDRVFAVMALCPQHRFQILTKRTGRMREYFNAVGRVRSFCEAVRTVGNEQWPESDGREEFDPAYQRQVNRWFKTYFHGSGSPFPKLTAWLSVGGCASDHFLRSEPGREYPSWVEWPLPNVWLGTSVENQPTADERIPELLRVPAAVRFLSMEPLLGPVNIRPYLQCLAQSMPGPLLNAGELHWIIVGGESGPGARPMHPDWVRSLRDQCQESGDPFFFKQWGEFGTASANITTGEPAFRMFTDHRHWVNKASTWVNGGTCVDMKGKVLLRGADFDTAVYPVAILHKLGKKKAGRLLDGREWNEMPAAVATPAASGGRV